LGAITFKFWVQLSSRDTEILLEKQAWYIKFESSEISKGIPGENRWQTICNIESCEISKGIPGENRLLAIWTENTMALKTLV
jgi:hypothetical protein